MKTHEPSFLDCDRLDRSTIEKIFVETVFDLQHIIVLDRIDIQPGNNCFCLQSHDLHGPLPEIVLTNSGDTFNDKDVLANP